MSRARGGQGADFLRQGALAQWLAAVLRRANYVFATPLRRDHIYQPCAAAVTNSAVINILIGKAQDRPRLYNGLIADAVPRNDLQDRRMNMARRRELRSPLQRPGSAGGDRHRAPLALPRQCCALLQRSRSPAMRRRRQRLPRQEMCHLKRGFPMPLADWLRAGDSIIVPGSHPAFTPVFTAQTTGYDPTQTLCTLGLTTTRSETKTL